MTTALCFNDITLSPITHQNSLWIRAAELARALGYSSENLVSRIYKRNAEEFTEEMTQVIEIGAEDHFGSVGRMRIFSLRGCHLIAMFARTPVAKQFRRWVLDVLDKLTAEERALHSADVNALSLSPAEQQHLQSIVSAKVGMLPKESQRKAYAEIWSRFGRHFQVAKYQQLPPARIGEAVEYLVGMEVKAAEKTLPTTKPKTLPIPMPEMTRSKLPLPYPFPKEKIDVLLSQISYYMLQIEHAERDVTEIMAAEHLRKNPDVPSTLQNRTYAHNLYLSCSTGSLWQSIDFALKAIEESVNLRLERAM